jgi:hypothetical protein
VYGEKWETLPGIHAPNHGTVDFFTYTLALRRSPPTWCP